MPPLRAWVSSLAVLSLGLLRASPTRAELIVVTASGSPPALAHAEVALAVGQAPGTTTTWLSLRIRRGPVAVVAALPEKAVSEPALDAWLTALERSASPQVLLPNGATDCGKSSSTVAVRWPRSQGVGGDELIVDRSEDATALLEEQGLGEGLRLPESARYVVWSWPTSAEDVTTTTWRLTGKDSSVSFTPAPRWPVIVDLMSAIPLTLPSETTVDQLRVTFVAGKPGSDYLEQLAEWMTREQRPLLEARASGNIFGWSVLHDSASVPPLVTSYARAAAEERDDVDVEACVEQLQAFERGAAPSAAACGSATDASVAFAATGAHPVLQRFVLPGQEPFGAGSFQEGGDPRSALLRAKRLDDGACPTVVMDPPLVLVPYPNGGAPSTGEGGRSPVVGTSEIVVVEESSSVSESCSCSPRPDPYYQDRQTVHCTSDTSSTSDDSCSSETSSTSDDSCSSDTSSTSDDGCASDTSSTNDDSCSSDSGSSYDGETCTGRAAPGAEPRPARAASSLSRAERPRRLRFSLWSVAFAASLLPIRRRKRTGRR